MCKANWANRTFMLQWNPATAVSAGHESGIKENYDGRL